MLRFLLTIWLCLFCSFFSASVSAQVNLNSPESLIESARKAAAKGENSVALEIYEDLLALFENSDQPREDILAYLNNEISVLARVLDQLEYSQGSAEAAIYHGRNSKISGPTMAVYFANHALALAELHKFQMAKKSFVESLNYLENSEPSPVKIHILTEFGVILQSLGDTSKARSKWSQAATLASAVPQSNQQLRRILRLKAGLELQEFALVEASETLSQLKKIGEAGLEEKLLEARFDLAVGELNKAEVSFNEIIDSAKGKDEEAGLIRASALYNLSEVYFARGDFQRAEATNFLAESAYVAVLGAEHYVVAQTTHRRAVLLQETGDLENSIALYKAVQAQIEAIFDSDHPIWISTTIELSTALSLSGFDHDALDTIRQINATQLEGRRKLLAVSALGLNLFRAGQYGQAKPHLKEAVEAWADGKYGLVDAPPTLNALAEIEITDGNYESAIKLATKSSTILAETGALSIARISEARRIAAEALMSLGRTREALEFAKQNRLAAATQLNEAAFASSATADFEPRQLRRQLGQYFNLVWETSGSSGAQQLFEAAQLLHLNETSRAALQTKRAWMRSQDGDLFKRNELVKEIRSAERRLNDEFRRDSIDKKIIADLTGSIAIRKSNLNILDGKIRSLRPDLMAFLAPQTVPLSQIQSKLKEGEALWVQSVFDDESYVFWITSGSIDVGRVPIGADELFDHVSKIRGSLDIAANKPFPEFASQESHRLFEVFFGSFDDQVSKTTHIYAMPDSAMQTISLATLVVNRKDRLPLQPKNQNRDLNFLGHMVSIALLPSLELLQKSNTPARESTNRLIGFGDPLLNGEEGLGSRGYYDAFDTTRGFADPAVLKEIFEPLSDSRWELEQIELVHGTDNSQLYFGAQASEAKLKQMDLAKIGTLVFATHAVVASDFDGLLEPALILSPPDTPSKQDDGLLLASEIAQLEIGARLVVLSACNTGAASGREGAPGFSGLASAFFQAGSHSVVATQWTILSVSSLLITPKMIDGIDRGNSTSESLRIAMKTAAERVGPDQLAHPAVWGPFVAIGAD